MQMFFYSFTSSKLQLLIKLSSMCLSFLKLNAFFHIIPIINIYMKGGVVKKILPRIMKIIFRMKWQLIQFTLEKHPILLWECHSRVLGDLMRVVEVLLTRLRVC